MSPISVAIIGLSSAGPSWASRAHLAYLLSPRGRERYRIVALCNSSIEAAEKVVKLYNLPSETKTYGDPGALAADAEVQLVVCSTRVDHHYDTVIPSVNAGKAIYLEWPLAHNIDRARDLVSAAQESRSRTVVGLQGRFAPVIQKAKSLVADERIGKVLSTEVRASGASTYPDELPLRLKYFTKKAIGGNLFTIFFGHLFDQVQYVLGEVQNLGGHVQIQHPVIKLTDESTRKIGEVVTSDVPDLIIAIGDFSASETVVAGATLLARFRLGQPFPGEPQLTWSIKGETGEIRLTAEGSTTIQAHGYDKPVKLEVHEFITGSVEAVEWKWAGWQEELPVVARSVGAFYEALYGDELNEVPTFEQGLYRHIQLESIC